MTTTNDLIQAIAAGDATNIESTFNAAMAEKIAGRLDDMRNDIAQSMFSTPEAAVEVEPAPAE